MKNKLGHISIIILAVGFVAGFITAFYFLDWWNFKRGMLSADLFPREEVFDEPKISGNKEDLISFSVAPGDEVSGVLNFSGTVQNGYFFEGNIGINILDQNKKLLKAGNAMATTDWMTSEPVSFGGTIDLTGLPPGPGYLQIANDNASGLPENDKFIYIPIVISPSQARATESEILAQLNSDWQSIQATFKNRPGHPGTIAWIGPYMVQFIGRNNLLIDYEDGYVANTAVLNYESGQFKILETFNNHGLFTLSEWQDLVKKYGDPTYPVSSYSINAIRNNEIISFPELTKVPENVFVKDYPLISETDTYTYKNHGFTIELPKGFIPEDRLAENGPAYIVSLPTGGLTYVTDATWWEKYNITPSYTYLKSQKIGETTFTIYEYNGFRFYWFRQGNVGYEFSSNDTIKLEALLKTFKFIGWPMPCTDVTGVTCPYVEGSGFYPSITN